VKRVSTGTLCLLILTGFALATGFGGSGTTKNQNTPYTANGDVNSQSGDVHVDIQSHEAESVYYTATAYETDSGGNLVVRNTQGPWPSSDESPDLYGQHTLSEMNAELALYYQRVLAGDLQKVELVVDVYYRTLFPVPGGMDHARFEISIEKVGGEMTVSFTDLSHN
jgi:hypothetical protein